MTKIYMVESLFIEKDLEQKWALVKEYYERAYKMKFKGKPESEKIKELYKKMRELNSTEFFYKENARRPK